MSQPFLPSGASQNLSGLSAADTSHRIKQNREIERKFFIVAPPAQISAYRRKEIAQGYLAVTGDGTEVRLRRQGELFTQTVKSDGDLIRMEWEIELTGEQFESLWPATAGKRIEKTRYKIAYEDTVIVLDVYHGALEGLCTAEVEFISQQESERFIPPAWFGMEITGDMRYKNKNLACYGIPEVVS